LAGSSGEERKGEDDGARRESWRRRAGEVDERKKKGKERGGERLTGGAQLSAKRKRKRKRGRGRGLVRGGVDGPLCCRDRKEGRVPLFFSFVSNTLFKSNFTLKFNSNFF
jgi:hypothetical protein